MLVRLLGVTIRTIALSRGNRGVYLSFGSAARVRCYCGLRLLGNASYITVIASSGIYF